MHVTDMQEEMNSINYYDADILMFFLEKKHPLLQFYQ